LKRDFPHGGGHDDRLNQSREWKILFGSRLVDHVWNRQCRLNNVYRKHASMRLLIGGICLAKVSFVAASSIKVQNIILSDFRRCLRDEFNEISTRRRKSSQQMVTENRKSFPAMATGGSGKAGGRFSERGRQRLPKVRDGNIQQETQPFGGGI
jgi:hypothetical protein